MNTILRFIIANADLSWLYACVQFISLDVAASSAAKSGRPPSRPRSWRLEFLDMFRTTVYTVMTQILFHLNNAYNDIVDCPI